ncbi:ammonium transporter [Alkalispirochaeta alkalica]|uniref:ammonium transporter n=1 Tax=Alkalispirochaeta alkalica TaxID=46356 RepID=UPI0003642AF8|nr:ammonium transporter [Alkalispirochaeta alkalica]
MGRRIFVLALLMTAVSLGQATAHDVEAVLELHRQAFDMIWLTLAGALVFLMQAGFAMVETGLTRAKNAGNIIMKNLMDFSMGAVAYFAVGWAIMYGASAAGLVGTDQFFLAGADSADFRDWFFQVVFAATAATIVSGAMAERTKYSGYLLYSAVVSGLIYPVSGHWIWADAGWLTEMGFHDFAGSTVVHSVGAWAALAGAVMIGARRGKYVKVGDTVTVKAIQGHNMPLAALGVFILWFGWYGFNAGSTLSGTDLDIAYVATTTTLAASAGAIAAMATSWKWFGKPDPSMSLNGALAGLVAITAGTWVISPGMSLLVGAVGGIIVVFSVEIIDKILHIDDPVGAISVHGITGIWGTLAVGLFGDLELIGSGLTRGGQIGVQAIGVGAVLVWVLGTSFALFYLLKKLGLLRVSPEEELLGLDISEHGSESYAGFQVFSNV